MEFKRYGIKDRPNKAFVRQFTPRGGAPERKNGKNDDTFRSYQLDFFKFILAIYVFISHTQCFVGENTRIKLPANIGGDSVHVFFIISGMLMANSIYKHYSDQYISQPGKGAMTFLMSKVKSMLPQSMAALLISFSVLSICVYKDLNAILYNLTTIFPEMFFINQAGMDIRFNPPMWYVSAMLICMLPMAYLLIKKSDFMLYVCAPLSAVISLGVMCMANDYGWSYIFVNVIINVHYEGLIRALAGLNFGICAYTIYSKICEDDKLPNVFYTFLEVVLYCLFFVVTLFFDNSLIARNVMSVLLTVPITVAITFSGKSNVSKLFRFRWMRYFSPISFDIFLNHWAAHVIVENVFPARSYKFSVMIMALLTILFSMINHLIVKLCNLVVKKYVFEATKKEGLG